MTNLKTKDFYELVLEHLEAIESLYEEYGFADEKEEFDSMKLADEAFDADAADSSELFRFKDLINDAKNIAEEYS